MSRYVYLGAGFFSLLLGFIGAFLPVLPTVPFVLLASWCFARSSPRFHRYLRQHQKFGKAVREWEDYGIVSRKAKWISTVMVALSLSLSSYFMGRERLWVSASVILICVLVFIWLWLRPEHLKENGRGDRI